MIRHSALLASAALAAALMAHGFAHAQSVNAGNRTATAALPFTAQPVAEFDTPWAIAFLPDGRMLVTEKPGRIFLVSEDGQKLELDNVPDVAASGQNGLLDIAVAPDFAASSRSYFTYVEPDDGGSRLVLPHIEKGRLRRVLEGWSPYWDG